MDRRLTFTAALLGASAVLFGAMGAHGVKNLVATLPDAAQRLEWWEIGARYHLPHAFAVGLCAVLAMHTPSKLPRLAAWLFVLGVGLFSGSLYALALTGVRTLGLITPFGGLAMTAGWTLVAIAALRMPQGARAGG